MEWLRWIFLGPFGLRSAWRAAAWVISLTGFVVGLGVVAGLGFFLTGVDPQTLPEEVQMAFNAVLVLPAVLVTWLFVRFLDKRPLVSVGLGGGAGEAARSTAIGTAGGLLAITSGCAALVAGGAASISRAPLDPWLPLVAVELLFAAAFEELLFRGYAFQWISRGAGFPVAAGLTALGFGVVHLGNPNVGKFAFVLIVLSGLLLAYARVASRDLWVPIGLHFGWNAAQGLVFGVPISGIKGWPSLFHTSLEGPELVTGGKFGFEASLGGLIALVTAFTLLALLARKRTPDWRMEGGAAGAPSVPNTPIVG